MIHTRRTVSTACTNGAAMGERNETWPTGADVRRARQRLGYSQADLARNLGTSQQSVARWERGERRQPRFERLLREFVGVHEDPTVVSFPSPTSRLDEPKLTERQSRAIDA